MHDRGNAGSRMTEANWRSYVRTNLASQRLVPPLSEEVIEELAAHLHDVYQDALRLGLSLEIAFARANREAADWRRLAKSIRHARKEEDPMSHDAKTLWVPGVSTLVIASLFGMTMTRLLVVLWGQPRATLLVAGPWLCSYFVFGALGAFWSRRVGGARWKRFLSGTFPATLHLATFLVIVVSAMISETRPLAFFARVFVFWVIIPAAALALGTLPFLRNPAAKAVPAAS